MAGRETSESELVAADVVADLVGGCWHSRDGVRAPDAMHDFDVALPGGGQIALEVTSIADPDVVSFRSVLSDTDWLAPTLKCDWWVVLPDPEPRQPILRIKRRAAAIVKALLSLEEYDVTVLGPDVLETSTRPTIEPVPVAVRSAIDTLISVGVTLVRSTGRRDGDVARLVFSTHGSAVGNPQQLNTLVAEQAHDNHEKLAAAHASERHLFVWLWDTHPDAEAAFSSSPPSAVPTIPPNIDAVWLARYAWPVKLWRLRPPHAWEPLEVIYEPLTVSDRQCPQ